MIELFKSNFKVHNDFGIIYSREGKEIIVDRDKVEWLAGEYIWYLNKSGEPTTNIKINKVAYRLSLKSIIMGKKLGDKRIIYYKNNNPLDNQENNLTYCKKQNNNT